MKRPSAPFLLSYGAVTLTDESSDLLLVGHKLAVERLEASNLSRGRLSGFLLSRPIARLIKASYLLSGQSAAVN